MDGADFGILVVDNGSTDETTEWLADQYPAVRILKHASPLSFAAAVNKGIAEARYSRTLLLNNDMIVEPGFIESLKNPQTIVITAAAADRTSFGCSNDRDLTYFGEAFYRDALPEAHSLRDAFEKAKTAIGARERQEHAAASKPQAYFGAEMEAKLASMNAAAR